VTVDGQIDVNNAAAEILGYTPEELFHRNWREITLPEDQEQIEEVYNSLLEGHRNLAHLRRRYIHKAGYIIWADVTIAMRRNENSNPEFFIATIQHTEKEKYIEQYTQENDTQCRSIFESANEGICITSPDSSIVDVNDAFIKIFGYADKRELLSTNITERIYLQKAEREKILRLLHEKGSVKSLEVKMKKMDGTPLIASISAIAKKDANGKIVSIASLVQDITEKKKQENQLRTLSLVIEQSPASILITDTLGNIEYVNTKFCEISGYQEHEVIGKNFRIIKSGEIQEAEKIFWDNILSGMHWTGELCNQKKSGELVWSHASIAPIFDEQGEILHFVAINEDLSEKKALENQLLRAQRLESIGTLTSGIAHDLNNVLCPILVALDVLEQKVNDEKGRNWVQTLALGAKRGTEIIKQMLAFSRGNQAAPVQIQPEHIIQELLKIIEETFPKSINIRTHLPQNLWTLVADPTQLQQVLLNICVNARDAMPEGGTLTISAENIEHDTTSCRIHQDAKPGPYILLQITDTGEGISTEILDKIFDPFFTTKAIGKGTGLGLSTVHSIVKRHDGFIIVDTMMGKGTTFNIYFPAKTSIYFNELRNTVDSVPWGNRELILLVDDETGMREITKDILEVHDYRVITAKNGSEALTLYSEFKKDIAVVVTDMMMPNLNGEGMIRELFKINPLVKIIAMSGLIDEIHIASQETNTRILYLNKPFSAGTLLVMLRRLLDR